METLIVSILLLGIACIAAAIVGGGLKAFGIEIPVVRKRSQLILLALLGIILVGAAIAGIVVSPPPVPPSPTKTPVSPQLKLAAKQETDAASELAEALERIISKAVKYHDTLARRNEKAQLRSLNQQFVSVEVEKQLIYDRIQEYLKKPSPQLWSDITGRIRNAIEDLGRLTRALNKVGGDFSIKEPPAYRDLLSRVESKEELLIKFSNSPPKSSEEIDDLKHLGMDLFAELQSLKRASDVLAKYITVSYADVR